MKTGDAAAAPVATDIEPKSGDAVSAWRELSALSPARVGLGRSGVSLPTREILSFGLAHARARDAVHEALDIDALSVQLKSEYGPPLRVRSAAPDRATYLARPDWGRRLTTACAAALDASRAPCDLVLVLADGLSAAALHRHAVNLIDALRPHLATFVVGPLVIATQARVALADEIGERLGARMVVCLIGERPGLSSPDSLGAYLTWAPHVGCTDAERNCVSNIHGGGLTCDEAAAQIDCIVRAAFARQLTGVALARTAALSATQSAT